MSLPAQNQHKLGPANWRGFCLGPSAIALAFYGTMVLVLAVGDTLDTTNIASAGEIWVEPDLHFIQDNAFEYITRLQGRLFEYPMC